MIELTAFISTPTAIKRHDDSRVEIGGFSGVVLTFVGHSKRVEAAAAFAAVGKRPSTEKTEAIGSVFVELELDGDEEWSSKGFIVRAWGDGWTIAFHCYGDAAERMAKALGVPTADHGPAKGAVPTATPNARPSSPTSTDRQ